MGVANVVPPGLGPPRLGSRSRGVEGMRIDVDDVGDIGDEDRQDQHEHKNEQRQLSDFHLPPVAATLLTPTGYLRTSRENREYIYRIDDALLCAREIKSASSTWDY